MSQELIKSLAGKKWQKIGTKKRRGINLGLFSVYSKDSIGIGEIPDIKTLVDWCLKSGISLIQFLPLNDTGWQFTPYDSQSSFALDPMYLRLTELKDIKLQDEEKDFYIGINKLQKKYLPKANSTIPYVNYSIKKDKLKILFDIFSHNIEKISKNPSFKKFCKEQNYWLEDYAKFKILKFKHKQSSWKTWKKSSEKNLDPGLMTFHKWLQWQLFLQFKNAHEYASKKKVLLKGDLPFLTSFESADVWAKQKYFKLKLASGAPPDMLCELGQRWGMPPFNWQEIAKDKYKYWEKKLGYAENFYDMFRLDHAVGLFRVWTINTKEDLKTQGLNGKFDPIEKGKWNAQGRKILRMILNKTSMMPCAEDLGIVPDCATKTLKDFGILGIDVQRWSFDPNKQKQFLDYKKYRKNSIATLATHDMSSFQVWYEHEAKEAEKKNYLKLIDEKKYSKKLNKNICIKTLKKICSSNSVFTVLLLHDWLMLTGEALYKDKRFYINKPGTISKRNWAVRMPYPIEKMPVIKLKI